MPVDQGIRTGTDRAWRDGICRAIFVLVTSTGGDFTDSAAYYQRTALLLPVAFPVPGKLTEQFVGAGGCGLLILRKAVLLTPFLLELAGFHRAVQMKVVARFRLCLAGQKPKQMSPSRLRLNAVAKLCLARRRRQQYLATNQTENGGLYAA
jgi:hypothetical protein